MVPRPSSCQSIAFAVASTLFSSAGCFLGDVAAPARVQDMPGVWIGQQSRHWGSVYRLELKSDGTGLLAASADNTEPPHAHLYELSRWSLDDGRFTCDVRQLAPESHPVPLKVEGHATAPAFLTLRLAERDDSGHWESSELRMVTEAEFLADLDRQRLAAQMLGSRVRTYRAEGAWDAR